MHYTNPNKYFTFNGYIQKRQLAIVKPKQSNRRKCVYIYNYSVRNLALITRLSRWQAGTGELMCNTDGAIIKCQSRAKTTWPSCDAVTDDWEQHYVTGGPSNL